MKEKTTYPDSLARRRASHPIAPESPADLFASQGNRSGLQMNAQSRHGTCGGVAVKLAGANDNALLKADEKSQRHDGPICDEQSGVVLVPFKDLASFVNA